MLLFVLFISPLGISRAPFYNFVVNDAHVSHVYSPLHHHLVIFGRKYLFMYFTSMSSSTHRTSFYTKCLVWFVCTNHKHKMKIAQSVITMSILYILFNSNWIANLSEKRGSVTIWMECNGKRNDWKFTLNAINKSRKTNWIYQFTEWCVYCLHLVSRSTYVDVLVLLLFIFQWKLSNKWW